MSTPKYLLKFSLSLMLCALVLSGCDDKPKSDQFEISGKLGTYVNSKVYLDQMLPESARCVDSTTTDLQGEFTMKREFAGNQIYQIRLQNNQTMLLFPQKDKISITTQSDQISNGKASGNAGTVSLQAFEVQRMAIRSEYAHENRTLNHLNIDNNPEGWMYQEAKTDRVMEKYREFVRNFADTILEPELANYAVFNLNPEGDFYYMQKHVDARKAAGDKSAYVVKMESNLNTLGNDFVRFEVTDFKAADASGDSISLSSYRSKVVYFYIWASYCGMSRMESTRLAAWKHSHPEVPIEIVTFSIDDNEPHWRKAILEDSLDWKGQFRGQFEWSSQEIQQFMVKSIPVSFLIDAKGIIRSKNVHASDLEHDFEEIVKKWGVREN